MKASSLIRVIAIVALFTVTGCTARQPSPYAPLEDAGIQVLSTTNPYHGPNSLLGQTLEESPRLVGYFLHRGAPRAIEVRKARSSMDQLIFYYPEEYQAYVATKDKRRTGTDWMIAGPYGIGKHDRRRIINFMEHTYEAPVFLVNGSAMRYHRNAPVLQRANVFEPEIPLIAQPAPKPKPKPKAVEKPKPEVVERKKEEGSQKLTAKLPNLDDPKFIPKNSDQVALLESAGYARRAPNGDILHDIEGNAQLLESIANWYMGSAKLVPLLRDANSFPDSQTDARKGVVIRIPLEYVKKTKRMPMNHRVAAVEEPIPAPAPKSTKKEKVGMEAIVAEDAPELLQNS